ncbi:MAG: LacI family DNA-binding transcriptional regulator [Atribacterota bacterium]|nr:LacI family DNA-binding transcriptional regulator [Atribacterota bacterium]MDD4896253.1 LacI family DNA-binding transcriptional regulator [Atribacterota bacterium]MDD5636982.1 LacI family DNA-binding transcriptional regulator [Atribacterota bacterium]
MRTTMKDIAKAVGVHPSTVSRVINGNPNISEKTAKKVFSTIEDLNYTPNALARGLKTKKIQTLAMLIPDISNPFFAGLARGVEDTANKYGYNVILCNTDDCLEKEANYLRLLTEKCVEGVIMATAKIRDKSIIELGRTRCPYILLSRNIKGVQENSISIDDIAGGYLATEYLISLGHQKIAHIAGPYNTTAALDRIKGYQKALQKYGIPFQRFYLGEGDFRIKGGYQVMKQFLQLEVPPTAVFTANDLLAVGAIEAIREHNFEVPSDFSIVGFDDIKLASYLSLPLTTIRQPMVEMGSLAIIKLLERIERKANHPNILIKPELIKRKSCREID